MIKEIEIGRRAREMQVNDALGLRRKMRETRRERIGRSQRRAHGLRPKQRAEGDGAQTHRGFLQKMPASRVNQRVEVRIHRGVAAHGFIKNSSRLSNTLPTTVQAANSAAFASGASAPSGTVATVRAWFASREKRSSDFV